MTIDATVLFCVGATKSGTSWLHRYLKGHDQCHMRTIKELHYFDGMAAADKDWQIAQLTKARDQFALGLDPDYPEEFAKNLAKVADHEGLIELLSAPSEDIPAYLNYLDAGRQDQRVVADVTPSYSLVSADCLRRMATSAADTRFIYILRDPVARLWSHIRMRAARRVQGADQILARSSGILGRIIRRNFVRPITIRGDYRSALDKLGAAVEPSRLLVLFYEELFTVAAVRRICEFLNIGYQPAKLAIRVNPGPDLEMTREQYAQAREFLADQYDYVQQKLGRVPDAWTNGFNRGRF